MEEELHTTLPSESSPEELVRRIQELELEKVIIRQEFDNYVKLNHPSQTLLISTPLRISEFGGYKGEIIENWISEAQGVLRHDAPNSIYAKDPMALLCSGLKGEARNWFWMQETIDVETPEKLFTALRKAMGRSKTLNEAFSKARTQEANEETKQRELKRDKKESKKNKEKNKLFCHRCLYQWKNHKNSSFGCSTSLSKLALSCL